LHAAPDPIAAEGVHDVLNWHVCGCNLCECGCNLRPAIAKGGDLADPHADASCIRGGGANIESEVADAGAENINGIVTRVRCDSGGKSWQPLAQCGRGAGTAVTCN
jgi:hypothetical protein